jgi:hypothetical protein
MARDSARLRKLADLSRQLADDCYSTEAREALLRTASDMDRKAAIVERLLGIEPPEEVEQAILTH